jgi:hypothetical protein
MKMQPLAAIDGFKSPICSQRLQFSVDDARSIALFLGDISKLQEVLCSEPQVQLLGMEIFDRAYPGVALRKPGIKSSIKILLARGAKLGRFAPSSKLLRKIEADEIPAWIQRYLNSMARAGMELPEPVQHQVCKFLE